MNKLTGIALSHSAQDAKDIVIVPRRMYRDPFRPGNNNIIVLADTYQATKSVALSVSLMDPAFSVARSPAVMKKTMARPQSSIHVLPVNQRP